MVQLGAEVTGKSDFSSIFGREETPLEGLLGAKINIDPGFTIMTAGGAGLTPGVGTPEFRALLGVSWSPRDSDFDKDGIPNSKDECPRDPEDLDGFEDEDGCPELDNDGDGIADADDQCPNEPEDMDEFEDENGCPDPDNDGDAILDADDNCPNEPGRQEDGGCPNPDVDGDGIPNESDKCPDDAEDMDGFQDEDGCPEPDNDNDGIFDAEDQCPNEPGLKEDNGCPPKETKAVREGETIKILDRVYFETGKAEIKPESFNLLDQVALILRSNPDIKKVEIAGHTDDVGADEKNMVLSQERADSVRLYLMEREIAGDRLVAKGYGETKPLTPNRNNAARSMNRRVEFNILEQ
jgi:outer membrane protein OmpA-like peptidoglycan-associated protein